ncbi:hypothetical protein BUALT_Bualt02G0046600 [Buddleja alternifolia]|uniref:Transmembrane protein n=1 Tax=Buddleja alternifolia TaxID=168488 RepID=A0AAV6XXD0_9LAMI|nr:hypothetical protein BUALT_Bualt02G0046600 [Buddleja alternifolia]
MALLLIFTILSFLSITRAQDRGHGLDNESPIALSPQAYTFFHPDTVQPSTNSPYDSSDCRSLPIAATVQSTPAHESASTGRKGLGAGGIVGIPLGFVFACLVGVGAYYVVIKRKANFRRANVEQKADV